MIRLTLSVLGALSVLTAGAEGPATPENTARCQDAITKDLRAADAAYRDKLNALLGEATLAGHEALASDIKARLAASERYSAKGAAPALKKTLIKGSLKNGAELVLKRDSMNWRDLQPYGSVDDLVVNGVNWEVRWQDGICKTPMEMEFGELVRFEVAGKITARRIVRSDGVVGLKLSTLAPGERSERASFQLRLYHK